MTSYAVYRGRGNGANEWDLLTPTNITTTSFTDSNLDPLTEYHYRVIGFNANGAASQTAEVFGSSGPTTPVSSPWISQEIGAVGGTGAAGQSGGTFTLVGGGADIWGTSDAFHYVYTPMSGDGYIEARVASMKDPAVNYYSRAGIMIRDTNTDGTTSVGSNQVSLMLHTTDGGIRMQYRTSTNGGTGETAPASLASARAPYWLRLERTGNTIVGKVSTDHVNWTTVDTISVTMSSTVLIGMALTPRDNNYLHFASFDHVSSTVTGVASSGPELDSAPQQPQQQPPLTLPESVLAGGALGGSSTALQAAAAYLCQCCLDDAGIELAGAACPDDHIPAILPDPPQFTELGESHANSDSMLENAFVQPIASLTAFSPSIWNYVNEHHRAVEHAFDGLERQSLLGNEDASLLNSVVTEHAQTNSGSISGDGETGNPIAIDRGRSETNSAGEESDLTTKLTTTWRF